MNCSIKGRDARIERLYDNNPPAWLSHVTTSGDGPTGVREGIEDTMILTLPCPRNSLLKIRNSAVLGYFNGYFRLIHTGLSGLMGGKYLVGFRVVDYDAQPNLPLKLY
jgi:hypothetical protein